MHSIWLSAVLPCMLFVVWAFPGTRRPGIWSICLGLAILGFVAVIGIDLFSFFSLGGRPEHGFMRALFAIILATDVPLIAFGIGSVVNWGISRRVSRKQIPGSIQVDVPV